MNLIWNNNKKAFQQRFPQLFTLLNQEINTVDSICQDEIKLQDFICNFFIISEAKNGELTASSNSVHLHSSYNPSREAASLISKSNLKEKSTAVFYGTGLGYPVFETVKQFPSKKILIIEPDPFRFLCVLTLMDWTKVFEHQQLIIALACPQDQILAILEDPSRINTGDEGVSDAVFFDIPSLYAHSKTYFETIKTLVQRNIQKNQINAATLKKFGRLWIHNSLKNMNHLLTENGISILENKGQNLPFVIVGAGPGLSSVIPHLKEIQKRAFLVCVETALHSLLRNNIQPDFIILLDSQYWAYKHIAGLKSPESILITDVAAYPSVFRFQCKNILLCDSQFPSAQYFQDKLGLQKGNLGSGGSVACAAWNFAHYCGAKNIYFAGVDLAFPGKQTHIKGSSAEQTFHKISCRTKTSEHYSITSLFSANAEKSQDYNNKEVITDSRMKMFAWWFESRLAACPETKTWTFCPQGLKIPGVNICHIESFIKENQEINKTPFLETAARKLQIAADKVQDFKELKKNFPNNTDFFQIYPFLKHYF